MVSLLKKALLAIFTKKRVVGWIGAVAIALGAAAAGMKSTEVREAVCGATLIEAPPAEK